MQDWPLPAELQQLEQDLGNRCLPEASKRLRQRVLDDLRSQLRAERSRDRWQFALATAGVALLWANLSMSATQATDFGLRQSVPSQSIGIVSQQIQQAVPELSPEEARREAILMRAGSTLVCLPDLTQNHRELGRNLGQISDTQDHDTRRGE